MKPILFNTEMVRAIFDNRKTVTRRVVKPQHLRVLDSPYHKKHPETPDRVLLERLCEPPYRPGDILYVRETWGLYHQEPGFYVYKADNHIGKEFDRFKWHPSIHMPREAARIFLRVTDMKVERLHDIGGPEIITKEGIAPHPYDYQTSEWYDAHPELLTDAARAAFAGLWENTIKPKGRALYGWDANPWVWVIEFERCERPEA